MEVDSLRIGQPQANGIAATRDQAKKASPRAGQARAGRHKMARKASSQGVEAKGKKDFRLC
jgi:hypothetical protein